MGRAWPWIMRKQCSILTGCLKRCRSPDWRVYRGTQRGSESKRSDGSSSGIGSAGAGGKREVGVGRVVGCGYRGVDRGQFSDGSAVKASFAPRKGVLSRSERAFFRGAKGDDLNAVILRRGNVNRDRHRVAAAAENDSFDGADIVIVSAPGQRDVLVLGHLIVGGIDGKPMAGAINSDSQA